MSLKPDDVFSIVNIVLDFKEFVNQNIQNAHMV